VHLGLARSAAAPHGDEVSVGQGHEVPAGVGRLQRGFGLQRKTPEATAGRDDVQFGAAARALPLHAHQIAVVEDLEGPRVGRGRQGGRRLQAKARRGLRSAPAGQRQQQRCTAPAEEFAPLHAHSPR
jgi:hypothetical protein